MKRKIKNRKLNSGLKKGLVALIPLTALCLMTSCETALQTKQYEYSRVELNSDGEYYETKHYIDTNQKDKNTITSTYTSYGRWKQTRDGKYVREVKEFDPKNKSLEDIKILIYSELTPEQVLGKPTKSYEQVAKTLTREEIERLEYDEATIYIKNEEKYVMVKDKNKNISVLIVGSIAMVMGVGLAISWKKYDDMISDKKEKKLTLKKRD
jgi:hypothetical protein